MGENSWSNAFLFLGIVVIVSALFDMGRGSYCEKYAARYGLNGLLELYKAWRNDQIFHVVFSIFIVIIIHFRHKLKLVSGPGSFLIGLTVLAGCFLWTIRPVPMKRHPRADYRKEAAKLVVGDGKGILALLDKLDGEVMRSESILRSRGFFFYSFLFPSAIVAGEKQVFVSPRIIPSDSVAYISYAKSRDGNHVYLFDKHTRELGEVFIYKAKDAEIFMSELNRHFGVLRFGEVVDVLLNKHFGVQRSVEVEVASNKRRLLMLVVIAMLSILILLYVAVVRNDY
jgi:hypothetical protein